MAQQNLPQAQDFRRCSDADISAGVEGKAVEGRPLVEPAGLALSSMGSASARQNRGVSSRSPRVLETSGDSRTGIVGVAISKNESFGPKMRSHMELADLALSPAAGPERGSSTRQSREGGHHSPRAQQSAAASLAAQKYTEDGNSAETQDTPCGTIRANDIESLLLDSAAATRVDSRQQAEVTALVMAAYEANQDLVGSHATCPLASSAEKAVRANSDASEQTSAAEDVEVATSEVEQPDDRIMEQLRNTPLLRCLSSVDIEEAVKRAAIKTYQAGDVILDSLSQSDKVYVILEGEVDVVKQRASSGEPPTSASSDIVTTLHTGDYFNGTPEDLSYAVNTYVARATEGADGARVVALEARVLALEAEEAMQRIALEDVSLSEECASVNMRSDLEAQSLNDHIEQYLQLVERSDALRAKDHRPRGGLVSLFGQRRWSRSSERGSEDNALLTALMTAFSPELGLDDVIERIVAVTSDLFEVARVGLFLVDDANNCLILKVSKHSRGITVPMKGIAGHTAATGEVVNLADVYLDPRFDPTLDKKTNFKTKQMVCVPVYDRPAHVAGVMQCNNTPDDQPFSKKDEDLLSVVAKQLGEVLSKQQIGVSDQVIPITRVSATGFSIQLKSVCIKGSHGALMVTAALFHGGVPIGGVMRSELVEARKFSADGERYSEAELDVDLEDSSIQWSCLPVGVRLIFNVYGRFQSSLGWAGCNLFTFEHHLRQGKVKLQLFPSACPTPNAPALENRDKDASLTTIEFELPTYDKPVVYQMPQADIGTTPRPEALRGLDIMEEITVKRLIALKNRPTEDEKRLLWKRRLYLAANVPAALPAFLFSVDWSDPDMLTETFKLLYTWATLPPHLALQLLDSGFPDPRVRAYAMQNLARLDDSDLASYMLQLTQVLKFQAFHDSVLSRFLLRRALSNPDELGHMLFWYIRAEMHNVAINERYGLLLDVYLRNCGSHRALLTRQLSVMQRLDDIACQVRGEETRQARQQKLHDLLRESDLGDEFQLPTSPKVLCSGVVVEECRVLESKKKPLLLTFATAHTGQDVPDERKLTVIFRSGDDLRQHQLALQVLGVMDRLWKAEGLDGCIHAYACVRTGDGTGLIEVVPDAMTVAQIVAEQSRRGADKGGPMTKMAAAYEALSRKDTLVKWLKANNKELGAAADRASVREEDSQDEQALDREGAAQAVEAPPKRMSIQKGAMKQVKRRFMLSCAGYCVATYVLGAGNRHNDNIMVKRSGEMFHINFQHFLGNSKTRFGFKRERAPFIFTPAFAEVLGDAELYREFEDTACKAFLSLRRNSTLLIALFSLTLSCGMPELETEHDLLWLQRSLALDLSEEQASARFKKLIAEALCSKCVLLHDALRLLRRA